MHRWTIWDFFQTIGALASIVGLIFVLSDKASESVRVILAILIVIGITVVIVSSVLARRSPLVHIGRDEMIETGTRLIRWAKSEVIMFAGDMSWANDYEEVIRTIANRGKKVKVIYPKTNVYKVQQNSQILKEAGAELVPTSKDSGLRAILIDPRDHADALLYVANRTLRKGAQSVNVGEHGTESSYQYVAKVYDMKRDWLLIRTVMKMYEVLYEASSG